MGIRRWTEAEAREVVADLRSSGLTVEQFARRRGLDPQRLYRWRRRLAGDAARPPTSSSRAIFLPASVPLPVAPPVMLRVGEAVLEIADTDAVPAAWLADFVVQLAKVRS